MNLIEVYIQEVTRRLPEKSRDDIALELRSTIEDMLSDEYSEEDVKEALEKLGDPAALASRYRDQPMHLIGPRYFDVYVSLLKMILPIASVIALISIIVYFVSNIGEEAIVNVVINVIGIGIWKMIGVCIHVFFWLTLVFVILERTDKGKGQQPLSAYIKKWTPDDLKSITYIPKKNAVSKYEVFLSLMWTAIWGTLYFYANQLVGVYEGGEAGLEFVMPAFNQDVLLHYWSIVIGVIVLEIGLALYKLINGQWTKKIAIFNTAIELIATVVFIVIISNPNLMNQEFIMYMSDIFSITTNQFKTWMVSGSLIIFILSAAWNVIDGFRKARIR